MSVINTPAEPRTWTVTTRNGAITITSSLSDLQAAEACRRVPAHHRDRQMASDMARAFDTLVQTHGNGGLTVRQRPWLHKLANEQLAREEQDRVRRELEATTPATEQVVARPQVMAAALPGPAIDSDVFELSDETSEQAEYRQQVTEPMQAAAATELAPTYQPNARRRGTRRVRNENPAPVAPPQPEPKYDNTKAETLRACLLIYDIPTPRRGEPEIPNPSPVLRRIAVRVNLSCWVIQEADIPYNLLHDMASRGAKWHVVPFSEKSGKQLLEMAVEALQKEVADAVRRNHTVMENAETVLGRAGNPHRLREEYTKRAEAALERFNTVVGDVEAAARHFGINTNALRLTRAAAAAQAIHTGMHTRARLYAEAAREIRGTRVTGADALANLAQADRLDSGIMADFLDDADYGSGEALRTAFRPTNDGN